MGVLEHRTTGASPRLLPLRPLLEMAPEPEARVARARWREAVRAGSRQLGGREGIRWGRGGRCRLSWVQWPESTGPSVPMWRAVRIVRDAALSLS